MYETWPCDKCSLWVHCTAVVIVNYHDACRWRACQRRDSLCLQMNLLTQSVLSMHCSLSLMLSRGLYHNSHSSQCSCYLKQSVLLEMMLCSSINLALWRCNIGSGNVMKFKFEFNNVRASSVFYRLKICQMFQAPCRMWISGKFGFYNCFCIHSKKLVAAREHRQTFSLSLLHYSYGDQLHHISSE